MELPPIDDLERLLAEAPFVRALARQLVVDDADEVVQQTWLAALEQRGQRVDRPRSWLARIVRNVASNLRRGEGRRRRREGVASPSDLVPSSAELVEREERRREVLAAVDGLPPSLRTVVLLRYYEGLPPRRIAQLLGVPVATVWTQLHRGLEHLRGRLDAQHGGDRRAWLVPLVPFVAGPDVGMPFAVPETLAPSTTSALVTGAIVMTTKTKLVAAAAVLIAAFGALLWWPEAGVPVGLPSPLANGEAPVAESAHRDPGVAEAAANTEVAPERSEATDAVAPTTGEVEVVLRYGDDHQPAPGHWLTLVPRGQNARFATARRRTDDTGRAHFAAVAPGRYYVAVANGPGKRAEVTAGATVSLEIELEVGVTLTGVVVGPDRAPVPGALVEVTMMAHADCFPEVVAVTGADGRFTARASPDLSLVGARAPGFTASNVRFVTGRNGNTADIELVLGAAGGSVDGVVVDPAGLPVEGAVVIVGEGELSGIPGRDHIPPFPALARSDDAGVFHAIGIPAGSQPVQVRAAGLAVWKGTCEVAAGGAVPLRVQLTAGGSVRGVVVDAAGNPVQRADVEVGGWQDVTHQRVLSASDGSFELKGLLPGVVEVRAAHDDHGKAKFEVTTVDGEVSSCELKLSRGLELVGRLLDPDGQPVAGAYVEGIALPGWSAFSQSDAQGRFVAANCPDGRAIRLRVSARGFEELIRTDVDPRAGELELRLERAAVPSVHVSGRVVDGDGRPVANAMVGVSRVDRRGSSGLIATDNDGRFTQGPLTPGTWKVWARTSEHVEFQSEPSELGPDAVWDLGTITLQRGSVAVVRVLGDAIEGARFYVTNALRTRSSSVSAVDGEQRSTPLAAGEYLLVVSGDGIAGQSVPFTVGADPRTMVDVQLAAGVRQGILVDAPGMPAGIDSVTVFVTRGDAPVARARCSRTEGDAFRGVVWLAPGDYRVEAVEGDRRATATLQVGAGVGDDVRITLR